MSWWDAVIPGGAVIVSWVLLGRILVVLNRTIGELRERVARLEGMADKKDR